MVWCEQFQGVDVTEFFPAVKSSRFFLSISLLDKLKRQVFHPSIAAGLKFPTYLPCVVGLLGLGAGVCGIMCRDQG